MVMQFIIIYFAVWYYVVYIRLKFQMFSNWQTQESVSAKTEYPPPPISPLLCLVPFLEENYKKYHTVLGGKLFPSLNTLSHVSVFCFFFSLSLLAQLLDFSLGFKSPVTRKLFERVGSLLYPWNLRPGPDYCTSVTLIRQNTDHSSQSSLARLMRC